MKNEATVSALDAYLDHDHRVPHAILFHGPWGVGKTTFLRKHYFDNHRSTCAAAIPLGHTGPRPPIWVSFFGLTDVASLQRRIREEISPVGSRLASIAGVGLEAAAGLLKIGGAADKAKGIIDDLMTPALLQNRIFVFDDIERAEGELAPLLGLVNQIVETHGGRVILVANEDELLARKDADWARRSEKLVGRRVTIDPDVGAVMNAFLASNRSEVLRKRLACVADRVRLVFDRSDTGNLRSLNWALDCVEAVMRAMPDSDVAPEVLDHIAAGIAASVIDLRAARVSGSELKNYFELGLCAAASGMRSGPATADDRPTVQDRAADRWNQFSRRYDGFLLEPPAIDYEIVVALESSGYIDPRAIGDNLRDRFSVGREEPAPAWLRLWYGLDLSEAAFEEAVVEFTNDLNAGRYVVAGEILHSAGIAVRLARYGETRPTAGQPINAFFCKYLDARSREGTLDMAHLHADDAFGRQLETVSLSLGYQESSDPQFQAVADNICSRFRADCLRSANAEAEAVIVAAEGGDLDPWKRAGTFGANEQLDHHPGFASIDPNRVVDIIVNGDGGLRIPVGCLLARDALVDQRPKLKDERDWARSVVSGVFEKLRDAGASRGLRADAVKRMIVSHDEGKTPERRLCK